MAPIRHRLVLVMSLAALQPTLIRAQGTGGDQASEAKSDPIELRAARFLFTEGNFLTDEQKRERALKAFALSFELYPAANTAVNIVGLLIDAEDYRSAQVWLQHARSLPDLNERAEEILAEFEGVISQHQGRVKLVLAEPTAFDVTIEDEPFSANELETGVRLNPGRYYLEVKQQGMVTFGTNVQVVAGKETEVQYKEHTIRRRQPPILEPVSFVPPPKKVSKKVVLPLPPPPPPAEPFFEKPLVRALIATAVGMTVLSTALLVNEAR